MPIRFLCTHCQKVLSIGSSKVDSVVHCPGCGGSVVVPQQSSPKAERVYQSAKKNHSQNAVAEQSPAEPNDPFDLPFPLEIQDTEGQEQFVLAPAESEPFPTEPESEEEILFEIRYKGQNVSVTKKRLLALARQGDVSPDDVITVAGTKIFADSVQGITFGHESPTVAAVPPVPATESENPDTYAVAGMDSVQGLFACYELEKNAVNAAPSESPRVESPPAEESVVPFDVADEPHAQVARLPRAQQDKKSFFSDLRETLDDPLSRASAETSNTLNRLNNRYVKIGGAIFVAVCLLGGLVYGVYGLISGEKSTIGAVRITGTVMLDGKPVVGATVILHPHDGVEGRAAMGSVNKRGVFTVTTDPDSVGCGALPGDYDVTFSKRGLIPREYEDPKTSGLTLTVEPKGKKRFLFELSSTGSTVPEVLLQTVVSPVLPPTHTETTVVLPTLPVATPLSPSQLSSRFQTIFAAAASGTVQDIEDFVSNDPASPHATDRSGNTPLHYAAKSNSDVAILRCLLVGGAVINAKNRAGRTPLDVAMASNRAPLRAVGAESGAEPPSPAHMPLPTPHLPQPSPRFSSIFEVAARGTVLDVEDFISRNPTSLHATDSSGDTPLHYAARSNSTVAVLRLLIARGALVHAKNMAGLTPFAVANTREKKEILRAEDESGEISGAQSIPTEKPESLQKPLLFMPSNIFEAAERGTVRNVEAFLEEGIDVNVKDGAGWTPLHYVASSLFNTDAKILEFLISKGADVNARDNRGRTPLDAANTGAKQDILTKNGGKRNWTP